jgi:signal transduction histidine kinase
LLVVALRSWQPLAKPHARYGLLAGSLAVTVIIYWLVLFHEQDWPHTFIEGEGLTPFKIEAELFIIAMFLVPAVLFYRQAQLRIAPFRAFDAANLFAAAIILILNELCFTLFSAMGDIFNLLGHLYKIVAYVFIYRAVFVESVREPYQRLRLEIEDRKQAEQNLEESRAQLRGMAARREEAREEERKYVAREVHDELGQILTGLQLNVSVITRKFAADSPPLREHLLETMMLTNSALDATRNIASALRPAALDMGIVSALEWLAGRFGSSTGIQCEVHIEETEIQLDENHAVALFRIVQESLTNVARHAKADQIDITLYREGDVYVLKIRDNGIGFDSSVKKENSFGLVGIRERALMLAGTVFINSLSGYGTEIVVRIPINNNSRKS